MSREWIIKVVGRLSISAIMSIFSQLPCKVRKITRLLLLNAWQCNESQNEPDCALAVWLFIGWHDPLETTGVCENWGSDNQAGSADTSANKGQISVHSWGLFLAWERFRLWQVCSVIFSRLGLEVGHMSWRGSSPIPPRNMTFDGYFNKRISEPKQTASSEKLDWREEGEKKKSNCGLHYDFALGQDSGADSRRWNLLSWTATLKAITWLSCQLEEYKGAWFGSVWIKRKENDQSMKVNRCLKEQLCTVWVSSRWVMNNPKKPIRTHWNRSKSLSWRENVEDSEVLEIRRLWHDGHCLG